jgi:hypothetical protein
MKTLNDYINESLLDDLEDLERDSDNGAKLSLIEKFLKENYNISGSYTISNDIVDVKGSVTVENKKLTELTNGLFEFGFVSGLFDCSDCAQLTSLEGAPKKVNIGFICSRCSKLINLEGSPEEVGMSFICGNCTKLTSLKGAPNKVGGSFNCSNCPSLKTLEGAPDEVGDNFNCSYCQKLTSLKGSPRNVEGNFTCTDCPRLDSLENTTRHIGGHLYCVRCKRNFDNSIDISKLLYKTRIEGNIYGYK